MEINGLRILGNSPDWEAERALMWRRIVEEPALERLNAKSSEPIVIPISLARWIVNLESMTPADLEAARADVMRPEVQASLATLRAGEAS